MAAPAPVVATLPSNVDKLRNGWFSEVNTQWPGIALSLEVEEILFEQKSEYQEILVFKSKTFGNVLVLDGVVQLTTRDECAYQEMIAHLPLFSHKNPEHVLIIGGGDGGVIREVVKHAGVKTITICEIDRVVIEAGKKFFPTVAAAWDDPRVTLECGDGTVFLAKPENQNKYDVIITDSSDPVGPAAALFESPFYQSMNSALKEDGKVCTQAESMWLHLDLIKKLVKDSSHTFANVEYATTQIPTYPAGQIGLLLCSKSSAKKAPSCVKPARKIAEADKAKFKYYSSELHSASFVLPAFVAEACAEARETALTEKKALAEQNKPASAAKGKRKSAAPAEEKDAKAAKADE